MRWLSRALVAAFFTVILGLAALMLVPAALGLDRYVITTGSMAGTIGPGSLIYDETVPVKDLRVGDVITFNPPPESELPGLVTHRIHRIFRDGANRLAIQTKGDANERPDTWSFVPSEPTMARVVGHVPYVGHAYARLNAPTGRMLAFALPGILIALGTVVGLWREAGTATREAVA